jgi:transposase-like protein
VRVDGRPKRLNEDKRKLAVRFYNEKQHSIDAICEMMGISKPTLYKYVREKDTAKSA